MFLYYKMFYTNILDSEEEYEEEEEEEYEDEAAEEKTNPDE